MPYAKQSIKVKIPDKSGFDKSHRNSGTLNCGTITPILCDEVIPGTRASLRLNLAAQFPPLVSDTYMNCKLKAEAFFVPSRLLRASFEDWFNDFPLRVISERARVLAERGPLPARERAVVADGLQHGRRGAALRLAAARGLQRPLDVVREGRTRVAYERDKLLENGHVPIIPQHGPPGEGETMFNTFCTAAFRCCASICALSLGQLTRDAG